MLLSNLSQDSEFHLEPRQALESVFTALQLHVDPGAVDKLLRALPPDIQSLFAPRVAARVELRDDEL
jgi:uncharacterized protein (DUF2267 family)